MSAADHSVPAECRTPPNGGAGPRNPRGIAESALARDVREGELRTFTACACARYAIPIAGELQQRPCCDESLPAVEGLSRDGVFRGRGPGLSLPVQ